jgi:hypothetical protein
LNDVFFNETITWTWSNSTLSNSFIPESSGYLSYEASLQNGCSKSDSINLIVIPTPSPNINGDSVLCSNSSWVNFNVTNTGNQIEWEIYNGQIQGQEYNSVFVNFDSTNNASVIVHESVWGTSCKGLDTLVISLSDDYALDPAQISILFPGSNILVSALDYPEMNWGYESKIQGNPIYVNQFNQYCEFIPLDTANYYYWVEISEGNECLTKSYFNAPILTASFHEVSLVDIPLLLYPNPTQQELNIINNSVENIEVYISDQTGRILDQLFVNGKTDMKMNISNLDSGSYFINYSSGKNWFIKKIIKL